MGVPLILYAGSAVSENTLLLGFSVNRDNGSLLPTRWTTYSRTFSSRQEGYGPKSVSQKDRFFSAPSRRGRRMVETEPSE